MKNTKNTKKNQSFILRIYNSSLALGIFSLLLAIVLWAVVKVNFSEVTTKTLSDMKVSLDSSFAEENGFYPFYSDENLNVKVQISGKSYDINSSSFSTNDIIIEASSGYVDASGYRSLAITATSTNPDVKVTSVEPSSLNIYFDRKVVQTFNVVAELENDLKEIAGENHIVGKPVPSLSTIDVEGPSTIISNLNHVVFSAKINQSKLPLNSSTEVDATVSFDTNSERGKNYLKCPSLSDESVTPTITVPVSIVKTVPVNVNYVNQPQSYNENPIPVTISPSEVKISCSGDDDIDSISIGTIDFLELTNKVNKFNFDVEKTSGYTILTELDSFSVSVDLSKMGKKLLNGTPDNVVFTGQQDGVNYSLDNEKTGPMDIEIYGPADALEKINIENIRLEINVSDLGDNNYLSPRVKISKISTEEDQCWASGEYYCFVKVG